MAVGQGINFAELLHRPIMDRLGVSATLTLVSGTYDILAIDKTRGVAILEAGSIVETLKPVVELMMSDMTALGVAKTELDDQTITLNGRAWTIISHRMMPTPSGEADGRVMLILEAND